MVKNTTDAKVGTSKKNNGLGVLRASITGLANNSVTYISVVATKNSVEKFVGSYGFITGAKLYWDATIPQVATSRANHWFNIASSGATYDGVIGNRGAGFSYDFSTKTFNNSSDATSGAADDDRAITFTELTDIKAVFLVADVSDQKTSILANSVNANVPHGKNNNLDIISGTSGNARVRGGKFWIGKNKINARADFDFVLNNNRVYGILMATSGATGVRANTTKYTTYNNYVWKGKFQKYLIFDTDAVSEPEAENIAKNLEYIRAGGVEIDGSISYSDVTFIIGQEEKTVDVIKTAISPTPAAVQGKTYTYVVDTSSGDPALPTGISLSESEGRITIADSVSAVSAQDDYKIKATINNDIKYIGSVFGTISITVENPFVGATNIAGTTADIVYSAMDSGMVYDVYTNDFIVKNLAAAKTGTKKVTTAADKSVASISGLASKSITYVSVVGKKGATEKYVGNYGFITGAKLYWDATVSKIANSRANHWLNIASSGASYDGAIGGAGADYTYASATKTFDNSDNGKNISFTELADVRAVFLVAEPSIDNGTCILAHSSEIPHEKSTGNKDMVAASGGNSRVEGGKFWIGLEEKSRGDFDFSLGNKRVYGILVDTTAGATGVRANTTKYTSFNDYVWRGKFQKYLIFDGAAVSEAQATKISAHLEGMRIGKAPITGTFSYSDTGYTIGSTVNKVINPDVSAISPSGLSLTYQIDTSGGNPALPSGISLANNGTLTIASSISATSDATYRIKATVPNGYMVSHLYGTVAIQVVNSYLGATNVGANSGTEADLSFAFVSDYNSFDIYNNNFLKTTVADAEGGTKKGTVTVFTGKFTVAGLANKVASYVSVVGKKADGTKKLIGSYGMITGAKLYWDATVKEIATSRANYWLNIASTGADYDGKIGGSGADYTYTDATKTFDNSANNKNIEFTEITDITALFLVAKIDSNKSGLAGNSHSSTYHFYTDINGPDLIDGNTHNHANVRGGKFWIGSEIKTRAAFHRQSTMAVYGLKTAGTGVKSDQTKINTWQNDVVWKGKYQKFLIFDAAISEHEVFKIAEHLEGMRTGTAPLLGSFSYSDIQYAIDSTVNRVITPDVSTIVPTGLSITYAIDTSGGNPALPSGIILANDGTLTIANSISAASDATYTIKGTVTTSGVHKDYELYDTVRIKIVSDIYVGATNVGANSGTEAEVVFSPIDDYSSYDIYTNDFLKTTVAGAEGGTKKGTLTDFTGKFTVTGLANKAPSYVSVVGKKADGTKKLMGSYGFITGAKLYWDATVKLIATDRAEHWLNIASSGSTYDGVIGNSGADYTYADATKTFDNTAANKVITYTELTDIRAVFLVANVSDQRTCILANSVGGNIPHEKSNVPELINASGGNARVQGGKFWIGATRAANRAAFDFSLNNKRVYGILVDTTVGATAVRANTTKFTTFNDYVWRGEFQKYLIFDTDAMTESEAANIAKHLEAMRTGTAPTP